MARLFLAIIFATSLLAQSTAVKVTHGSVLPSRCFQDRELFILNNTGMYRCGEGNAWIDIDTVGTSSTGTIVPPVAVAPTDTTTVIPLGVTLADPSQYTVGCAVTSTRKHTFIPDDWGINEELDIVTIYWDPSAGFTGTCSVFPAGGTAGGAVGTGMAYFDGLAGLPVTTPPVDRYYLGVDSTSKVGTVIDDHGDRSVMLRPNACSPLVVQSVEADGTVTCGLPSNYDPMDLNVNGTVLMDDFCGGHAGTYSGFGALNWQLNSGTVSSNNNNTISYNHPCILRLLTGSTATNWAGITLVMSVFPKPTAAAPSKFKFVFGPRSNDLSSGVERWRVGLVASIFASPSAAQTYWIGAKYNRQGPAQTVGTVACDGSTTVTGTGTAFNDGELATGDTFIVNGQSLAIATIDSATSLTVGAACNTVSGVTWTYTDQAVKLCGAANSVKSCAVTGYMTVTTGDWYTLYLRNGTGNQMVAGLKKHGDVSEDAHLLTIDFTAMTDISTLGPVFSVLTNSSPGGASGAWLDISAFRAQFYSAGR